LEREARVETRRQSDGGVGREKNYLAVMKRGKTKEQACNRVAPTRDPNPDRAMRVHRLDNTREGRHAGKEQRKHDTAPAHETTEGAVAAWVDSRPRKVAADQPHCKVSVWYTPARRGEEPDAAVFVSIAGKRAVRLYPEEAAALVQLLPALQDLAGPALIELARAAGSSAAPDSARVWPVPPPHAGQAQNPRNRVMGQVAAPWLVTCTVESLGGHDHYGSLFRGRPSCAPWQRHLGVSLVSARQYRGRHSLGAGDDVVGTGRNDVRPLLRFAAPAAGTGTGAGRGMKLAWHFLTRGACQAGLGLIGDGRGDSDVAFGRLASNVVRGSTPFAGKKPQS
jgi:hypothetical protein